MNRSPERLTTVAALRPWPFGPPLRGRAPHSDGGQRAARSSGARPRRDAATVGPARPQALAPVGGLACYHPAYSVQ